MRLLVAASLPVLAGAVVLAACGRSQTDPDGPRYCDDTFRLDKAGVRVLSDGSLEISQADESESDLCDHGLSTCERGWILRIEPELQVPGVHTWSHGEGSWVGCWVCDWGAEGTESPAGGGGLAQEESVTLEITAIDHEHIAGCIVAEPEDPTWGRQCGRDDVRFDVPCPADSR